MVYGDCRVYGPYRGKKDNRLRVIVLFNNGTRTTVSFPKFIVEKKLDRYLTEDETVDHIDNNPLNNDFNNLRIVSRSEHCRSETPSNKPQNFICPECKTVFILQNRKLSCAIAARKNGKTGPFCGKICAGKYGAKVQHDRSKQLVVIKINPSKYIPKNSIRMNLVSGSVAIEAK